MRSQHPTDVLEREKEAYRRFLDYKDRRAEIVKTLRFFESMGKPLSTREREILAEEENHEAL